MIPQPTYRLIACPDSLFCYPSRTLSSLTPSLSLSFSLFLSLSLSPSLSLTHFLCYLISHLVTVGDDGETALFKAAANGHASIVRRLLACGAAIDAPSKYGTTPLGAAVINRYAVGGRVCWVWVYIWIWGRGQAR